MLSFQSYRDFHSDLYPETNGYKTDLTASEWVTGVNRPLSKMNLDPAKRELGEQPIIVSNTYSIIYHPYLLFQCFLSPIL